MKRGEVWWINFDPAVGGEVRKVRPAIISSNNASNASLNRVQVAPITSSIDNLYPSEAYITLNGELCKAMADQLATVSKLRVRAKLGIISDEDMIQVERVIKIQLGLN